MLIPVTPEFGSVGKVTVPVPAVTVQTPVPSTGVFAAKVAVGLQIVWSIPALAVVGSGSTVIVMSSALGVQVPFVIVQVKVLTPVLIPVTPLVGLVGVVTDPVPAVTVQTPVPITGVLAASVAVAEHIV
jgi:hypothetical protein